jgi:hypothetical protein
MTGCWSYSHSVLYRRPPTISPGLTFFRKRFLMGLYKGGGALYTGGGLIHGLYMINNSDKQVGLYSGAGLIFRDEPIPEIAN